MANPEITACDDQLRTGQATKAKRLRRLVTCLSMLIAASTSAQPVYESHDQAGPVFSDRPTTGASEVVLPPINVMDSPQAPSEPRAPAAKAAAYTLLTVVQPENGGTVHSNTGQFSVRLAIEPALQTARGDTIAVRLDHTVLPTTRTALQFEISPAEWQSVANDSLEHQLEVAVVDRSGNAVIVSPAVHFYVHRATRR